MIFTQGILHAQAPFPSPKANPYEARVGSMYQLGPQHLRLDIGTQLELLNGDGLQDSTSWSAGVGFQTWTRLRAESNFKFPVETVDYWFGVHAMYGRASSWHVRMRLAHISSHLADGLADSAATLHPKQFVYSREFAEVLLGYTLGSIRPYLGATLVWSSIPDSPNTIIPQAGIDLSLPLDNVWSITGGYDLRLVGINNVYVAANAAQLGFQHQLHNTTALWMGLYAYSGRSMHGMFFKNQDSYLAAGFQVMW